MPKPIPLPRIMSVPPADPPYDDERAAADGAAEGGMPMTYGSLALAHVPEAPAPARVPETIPQARSAALREAVRARGTVRARGARPDERHLRCLGQAMAEVLAGRRPAETVQDRLSERAYRELVRAGKMIHAERPPLVGPPHAQWPRDGVAEMCVLVHCGTRSRVLALRLERFGVQWLVTEFETA
ncbi:Rv3235 family protein [Sphaerimonospora cavernae]|uniref:Rv3235 family protein n=1 Tax=Sphaerimonospora cavernae TaxID=1740611 RepID=A0ABV6U2W9_9ACTN